LLVNDIRTSSSRRLILYRTENLNRIRLVRVILHCLSERLKSIWDISESDTGATTVHQSCHAVIQQSWPKSDGLTTSDAAIPFASSITATQCLK